MFCSQCGKELPRNSKFCTECGKKLLVSSEIVAEKEIKNQIERPQNASSNDNSEYDERSGKGKDSIIPKEIIEWNWGAAGLGIIWGIYHKVWVSFLTLVVPFGWLAMGKAGNGWAWRNNKWKSVEEFKKAQTKWQSWGKVCFIIILAISTLPYLAFYLPITSSNSAPVNPIKNEFKPIQNQNKVNINNDLDVHGCGNSACKQSYGLFSFFSHFDLAENSCVCDCISGYMWNTVNTSCINSDLDEHGCGNSVCRQSFGLNSIFSHFDSVKNICVCDCVSGYIWNNSDITKATACILNCSDSQCLFNGKCVNKPINSYCANDGVNAWKCSNGYEEVGSLCIVQKSRDEVCRDLYGINSFWSEKMLECECRPGYVFNVIDNCVPKVSIDQICQQEYGINSYYLGYFKDDKYGCKQ